MNLKRFLKLGISFGLFGLILYYVDPVAVAKVLGTIPPWVIVVTLVGYGFGQILSSYKWWLIAREVGIKVSFLSALRSYFIGMFANSFGLGVVGGDLTRALLIAKGGNNKARAIATVAADRIHGLSVLLVIGIVFAVAIGTGDFNSYTIAVFLAVLCLVALAWVFGTKIVTNFISPKNRIGKTIHDLSEGFPQSISCIFKITVLSTLFHTLQILLHAVICMGLSKSVPLGVLFATVPFVNIFSSLPISWNGLGVREGGYIFFLTPLYLSQEEVVAMGALWLLAATLCSAIGGLVSVLNKNTNESQTDMDYDLSYCKR